MRAIRILGNRELEVTDFPEPEPAGDQVVIKIHASAICGTERRTYEAADALVMNAGHEAAGVVVGVDQAQHVKPGDRVSVWTGRHCGRCDYCLRGNWILCSGEQRQGGGYGLHAQYALVREDRLMPLPDDIPFDVGATMGDAVGTPYKAITRLGVTARDTVLVSGVGPLGAAATLICKHLNARVLAADVSESRLAVASQCGADAVVNPAADDLQEAVRAFTDGAGVDVVVECSGAPTAQRAALDAVRAEGRVAWIGIPHDDTTLSAGPQVILKDLTLIGSWYSRPADHAVMARLIQNGLPVHHMITHRFSIEEAAQAFEAFHSTAATKVIIDPWA